MTHNPTVKMHILNTTIEMLEKGFEADVLTIRKIAQKANVSVGLINYHFGSKDGLLLAAIHEIIWRVTAQENLLLMDSALLPKARLRKFLKGMATVVVQFKTFSRTMLRQEILSSSFATPAYLLEVLKEIKPMATDAELKWLSIEIVAPLQYIYLKETGFYAYMGTEDIDFEALIEGHLTVLGV